MTILLVMIAIIFSFFAHLSVKIAKHLMKETRVNYYRDVNKNFHFVDQNESSDHSRVHFSTCMHLQREGEKYLSKQRLSQIFFFGKKIAGKTCQVV